MRQPLPRTCQDDIFKLLVLNDVQGAELWNRKLIFISIMLEGSVNYVALLNSGCGC